MSQKYVSIFAGRATTELGTKIAEAYGTTLGKSTVVEFSDREFQPSFEESIRCSIPSMAPELTEQGYPRLDCIVTVVDALRMRDEFGSGLDLTRQNIDEEDID